jgi:hypothetical protein
MVNVVQTFRRHASQILHLPSDHVLAREMFRL